MKWSSCSKPSRKFVSESIIIKMVPTFTTFLALNYTYIFVEYIGITYV